MLSGRWLVNSVTIGRTEILKPASKHAASTDRNLVENKSFTASSSQTRIKGDHSGIYGVLVRIEKVEFKIAP